MAIRPTTPVYFAIGPGILTDDCENQFAFFDWMLRDLEGILDQVGRLGQMLFAGVIDAAQDAAGFDFLPDFNFEDYAYGRVDRIFFSVAARADHRRCLTDQLGIDTAHVASAAGGDLLRAGCVGQQIEAVENLRIAALRGDNVFKLAIARTVEQLGLRNLTGFIERLCDLAEKDHARREYER